MTTNLPTKVKVGALTYKITLDDRLHEDHGLMGQVNPVDTIIKIASGLSEQQRTVTLLHELTHAMLKEIGERELYGNEDFVERFSNMLTQVALDNGWRVAE
jgi:Zn-dependent peptidase ImmA (M78 family)